MSSGFGFMMYSVLGMSMTNHLVCWVGGNGAAWGDILLGGLFSSSFVLTAFEPFLSFSLMFYTCGDIYPFLFFGVVDEIGILGEGNHPVSWPVGRLCVGYCSCMCENESTSDFTRLYIYE